MTRAPISGASASCCSRRSRSSRPFEADNYNALLRTIIDDAPKSLLSFGVDQPELWSILTRGLAKAAIDRYPSMRDLGEALARWLLERGVTEDAVGTSLRRAWGNEVSAVVSIKDLLSPGELVPAVGALERASTQALAPSAASEAPVSVRVRPSPLDAHGPVMVALEEALKPPPSSIRSRIWKPWPSCIAAAIPKIACAATHSGAWS